METIHPWFEPTDTLRKLPRDKWHALMTREEHAFLSGIIKQIKPKKILEVGIAFGGTSALIIKSLEMEGIDSDVFSIDLNPVFRGEKTGYMINNITVPKNIKHSLVVGDLLKDKIDEIGGGIDLVILDTTHNIPGEILEFLTVLPFMSQDATVVLHDVVLSNKKATHNNQTGRSLRKICPKVLFSTVKAQKFYNYGNKIDLFPSNIAAFKINNSTYDNIEDLFFSLSHLWWDDWSKEVLDSYREYLSKFYPSHCIQLWDLIINNQQTYNRNIAKLKKYLRWYDSILLSYKENIIHYYLKLLKNKMRFIK